jgi:hypothetical protein
MDHRLWRREWEATLVVPTGGYLLGELLWIVADFLAPQLYQVGGQQFVNQQPLSIRTIDVWNGQRPLSTRTIDVWNGQCNDTTDNDFYVLQEPLAIDYEDVDDWPFVFVRPDGDLGIMSCTKVWKRSLTMATCRDHYLGRVEGHCVENHLLVLGRPRSIKQEFMKLDFDGNVLEYLPDPPVPIHNYSTPVYDRKRNRLWYMGRSTISTDILIYYDVCRNTWTKTSESPHSHHNRAGWGQLVILADEIYYIGGRTEDVACNCDKYRIIDNTWHTCIIPSLPSLPALPMLGKSDLVCAQAVAFYNVILFCSGEFITSWNPTNGSRNLVTKWPKTRRGFTLFSH